MNTARKATQGRQKIEIKKIENVSSRQVTFSKRRAGLFKKASELCVLTGAQVSVIVKSPGKRTFAFCHPSLDAVVNRYISGAVVDGVGDHLPVVVQSFNEHYAEVSRELEAEKRRRVAIEEAAAKGGGGVWWEADIGEMGVAELEKYAAALEELRKNVGVRIDEMMLMKASSSAVASARFLSMKDASGSFIGGSVSGGLAVEDCVGGGSLVPYGFGFGRGQF